MFPPLLPMVRRVKSDSAVRTQATPKRTFWPACLRILESARAAFSRSTFQEGTGENNRLATNPPWNTDVISTPAAARFGPIPTDQVYLDPGFTGLLAGQSGLPCNIATLGSVPYSCFSRARLHLQDSNYRPAVSNQWNIALQRQFGNTTTIQAAYVGQHNDHLASILNAGQSFLSP